MAELVMIDSKDQRRAEKAFKKLGVDKPVLWKDLKSVPTLTPNKP